MKQPGKLKVSDCRWLDAEPDKNDAIVYFVIDYGFPTKHPDYHWIHGLKKVKQVHEWLGKQIEYFESKPKKKKSKSK